MLEKSIRISCEKNDSSYCLDYVKLHKMLYLGQCITLAKYGFTLFEEDITAHHCGPYIEKKLDFIVAEYGFGKISTLVFSDGSTPLVLTLPCLREEIVDIILDKYGHLSTQEIVSITKNTNAYISLSGEYEYHPVISHAQMMQTGLVLLGEL